MAHLRFLRQDLVHFLKQNKIATLPELKAALGTPVDVTVFRKLKEIGYLSSYSHRGRYYTLAETPVFDAQGLWSYRGVHFSRYGSPTHHRRHGPRSSSYDNALGRGAFQPAGIHKDVKEGGAQGEKSTEEVHPETKDSEGKHIPKSITLLGARRWAGKGR